MQWTEEALVLRVGKFREWDEWVRLLCPQHGLITAFAFGAGKSRRRFPGCLDSLNVLLISIESSRDGRFLNLREATLLKGHENLRSDWKRQGMAANCLRFLEALGAPPDSSAAGYRLACQSIACLNGEAPVPSVFPLLFRFRLASDQGYVPNFGVCGRCGTDLAGKGANILLGEGMAVCPQCRRDGDMGMPVGREALDALTKVKEYPPDAWGRLLSDAESVRQMARLIDVFVRRHLGLEWDGGRFKAGV